MSDDEIIRDAREAFQLAADAEAENRREALDDLRFARLGEQWPERVRRERELDGRPCLTINRLPSLLSFVFNVGANPSWTIWKLLNAGRFDQIPAQLARFVNVNGVKVQGLAVRRAAEAVLWSTDEPGIRAEAISSAVTRAAATPPTPALPPRAGLGAHVVSAVGLVGTGCTAYAPLAKSWADRLAAFTGSSVMQHVTSGLLTLAGVATLVGLVSAELQRRAASR